MKHLPIESASFCYVEKSFREWLDILGYAPSTVYNLPNHIREFFYYLEQRGVVEITQITTGRIKEYYHYLKLRSNQRQGGGLSNSYLNKHLQALYKFMDYLRQSGRLELSYLTISREEKQDSQIMPLSVEEIQELYNATEKQTYQSKTEALASRDRAILTIFYGCGLRRNEGVHLDLSDINFDSKVLHVRKGKNYKERFVPFNAKGCQILQEYVYDYRPYFQRGSQKKDALFLSMRSRRMDGQSIALRLKLLQQKSDDVHLTQKDITLHLLRHSIATHLLSAGMELEKISRFLGHSSLESTQIYTHLLEGVVKQSNT